MEYHKRHTIKAQLARQQQQHTYTLHRVSKNCAQLFLSQLLQISTTERWQRG